MPSMLHPQRRSPVRAAAWLVPLCLLLGCSSGSGSSSNARVDGQWEGTWTTTEPASGSVTLSLSQEGPAVSGVIGLTGFPCFVEGSVACTMKGQALSGWCQQEQTRLRLHGQCHGHHGHHGHHANVLDAHFEITSGPCAGTAGTMHLTRVGAPGAEGPGSGALVPVGRGLWLESERDGPRAVTVWGPGY